MNILKTLGIEQREDCITNLLAAGLENSEAFRNFFLDRVAPGRRLNFDNWRVATRVATSQGIPDLIITGNSSEGELLVLIENKVKADEGFEQTLRYAHPDCASELSQKLGLRNLVEKRLVFLTLFPEAQCSSDQFFALTHQVLLDYPASKTSDAERLISDWQELIRPFYDHAKLIPEAPVFSMLSGDSLEAGYLYFKELVREVAARSNLDFAGSSRSSMSGRRIYFGSLDSPGWTQGELAPHGDKCGFDASEQHFAIFFQLQYNLIQNTLILRLKYETNPYKPESWVRKNMLPDHLEGYLAAREHFSQLLTNYLPNDWSIHLGWNQLAKTEISLSSMNTAECLSVIVERCQTMAPAVDDALSGIAKEALVQ